MMSASEKPNVDHSTTSFSKMSTPVSFAKESGAFSNGLKFLIGLSVGITFFVMFHQCIFKNNMKSTRPDKIVIITNIRANDAGDENYYYQDSDEGLTQVDEEGLIINTSENGDESTDKSPESGDGEVNSEILPCKPGEVKKIDCNTCRCTEEGSLACTKMSCEKNNVRLVIPVD